MSIKYTVWADLPAPLGTCLVGGDDEGLHRAGLSLFTAVEDAEGTVGADDGSGNLEEG